MSRTTTPTNRIEYRDNAGHPITHKAIWRGRATQARLVDWIENMDASMKPGECNEYISETFGFEPIIHYARIVNQSTGEVKAEWKAPLFRVVA